MCVEVFCETFNDEAASPGMTSTKAVEPTEEGYRGGEVASWPQDTGMLREGWRREPTVPTEATMELTAYRCGLLR